MWGGGRTLTAKGRCFCATPRTPPPFSPCCIPPADRSEPRAPRRRKFVGVLKPQQLACPYLCAPRLVTSRHRASHSVTGRPGAVFELSVPSHLVTCSLKAVVPRGDKSSRRGVSSAASSFPVPHSHSHSHIHAPLISLIARASDLQRLGGAFTRHFCLCSLVQPH